MKLCILFGQRKEEYEGEYAPEALVTWTEYDVDDNPKGFDEACEVARTTHAAFFIAFRLIDIEVDADRIRKLIIGTPKVPGRIIE